MATIIDTVRHTVGRRSRISREEMATILRAVPDLAHVSTIAGRDAEGALYVGGAWVYPVRVEDAELPPSQRPIRQPETTAAEVAATALAWARMCRGLTTVSVFDDRGDGARVRYDEPGSMAPYHHADLLFVPEDAAARPSTLRYLRDHAARVLIVRDDEDL